MMRQPLTAILVGALLLGGCNLAPAYQRPAEIVPPQWPQGPAYPAAADVAAGLTWRTLVADERLRTIVSRALTDNRDLRATVANVEAARAQYRIQRSTLLPTVTGQSGAQLNGGRPGDFNSYSANVGFSAFEIDLFGRQRNLRREAFERYLATAEGARSTRITLVAETANAWVTYAADNDLLAVARDTVASASRALQITNELDSAGLISKLDVREAETVLAQAQSDVESSITRLAQDKNALELLAGGSIDVALLPRSLVEIDPTLAVPPAGLASAVLLARPDVVSAEHQLKAANADIGAARAAFFPTISLTAALGLASTALSNLFTGGALGWTVQPGASIPIFGGPVRGNLAYSRAQREVYLNDYERAVQQAFRDVADALARRGTIGAQRAAQRRLVVANQQTLLLASAQYRAGIASFLNTLTAQRSLYVARQNEIITIQADLSNRLTLYSAIGADDPVP